MSLSLLCFLLLASECKAMKLNRPSWGAFGSYSEVCLDETMTK